MNRRLFSLLLLLPLASFADSSYNEILQQAISAFDDNYRDYWAFTEERTRSGTEAVGRYDPRETDRWRLLTVDGRAPTPEETEQYLEQKSREGRRDGDKQQGPDDMVSPDSLTLQEETADYWLFGFEPAGEGDDADFMKFLTGQMKIRKSGPVVAFIDIRSSGTFKPQFGVRVREFLTYLEFAPIQTDGPVVPMQMQFRIKARAFGLMNVDESVSVRYRDYEFVGD